MSPAPVLPSAPEVYDDPSLGPARPWYREMNGYHWFVFLVAALGWLFDCLDQQLFNLARKPAITELLGPGVTGNTVDSYSAYATAIFIIGWATGGLIFGVLGDRIGRAKTMMLTILLYSLFTGLSALSQNVWDFSIYRFLTGLGVGGEFAVGVALVAEVMPDRVRAHALGWLQMLSTVGNVSAAFISYGFGHLEGEGAFADSEWKPWRFMFVVGAIPALLAILVRARLKEPEKWQHAVAEGTSRHKAGSLAELFGDPRWRRNVLVGLGLSIPGVVGLWAIGFFSFDFVRTVLREQGLNPGEVTKAVSIASILQNIGAGFGIYAFKFFTERHGRRPAFAVAFVLAMIATAGTFWFFDGYYDIFWMIPIMGFCQLSLFGGYAIYFPELFPTRLRSTGTSFCYNVGRYGAALGTLTMGGLIRGVFGEFGDVMAWRYTAVTMCSVFLLGLLVLPFAPETRGQPLPE
ncbi:MAG TPA: MFS transporter [Pirellulales bacterium]|nr:MFS transporter [Pirellulales bacterium]HEX4146439.1 MFS transporter [Pirellulales bacterium]